MIAILAFTALWLVSGYLTFRVVVALSKGVMRPPVETYDSFKGTKVLGEPTYYRPVDGLRWTLFGGLSVVTGIIWGTIQSLEKVSNFLRGGGFNGSRVVNKIFGLGG